MTLNGVAIYIACIACCQHLLSVSTDSSYPVKRVHRQNIHKNSRYKESDLLWLTAEGNSRAVICFMEGTE